MSYSSKDPSWEERGDALVPPQLLAMWSPFPEQLCALYDPIKMRFCYRKIPFTEDCGLMVFTRAEIAYAYMQATPREAVYSKVQWVSLDEAHAMAAERHCLVNCLILFDNPRKPIVHFVR